MKGQEFELKLVDTAGQDEYAIFPAQHSMDMHGYVMVYSITSLQSFELVQVLLEKIMDMTGKITSVFQLIFKWSPFNFYDLLPQNTCYHCG